MEIGATMRVAAFSVKGELTQWTCSKVTDAIVKKIGMSPAHFASTYLYPIDGKGGNGFTYFQPITESFRLTL